MRISVIVPAYNEEKAIKNTIIGLKEEEYNNIIVVDDGSSDNTYEIAKSTGVTVLKHIINRGQGAALQTGMSYAMLNKTDIIVHFDADGQHNPKEIKNLLNPILNKEVEASLGSRFLKKQKIPFSRKLLLKGAILAIRVIYGIKLSDAHNGFRAFTYEAAKKINIESDGMEHASEIIGRIKKNQIKYKEVPVTILYTKETLQKGQRSSNAIRILFKMLLKKMGV